MMLDNNTIVENELGGRQSYIGARFDLVPPSSLKAVAHVLGRGAEKYGESNWKKITTNEHINHVLNHVNLYLLGDTSEPHLEHAMTRLMMAYHVDYHGVEVNAASHSKEQPSYEQLFKQNY